MNNLPPQYPYAPSVQQPLYPPLPGMNLAAYPNNPPFNPAFFNQMPVNQFATPVAASVPGQFPSPAVAAAPAAQASSVLTNPSFIKGAVIGGLAAYLLTNDKVQQTLISGSVKAWALLQGGVEEMKERFRDAEAELHAAHDPDLD